MIDSNKSIHWAIVDVEVSLSDQRIHDIGVLRYDGAVYHGCSKEDFEVFVQDAEFICGHNIIHQDDVEW
jgi:ATP-dependent DNA helicase RecQ